MNYNFLAAKNYSKKIAKEISLHELFSTCWNLCKAVGKKSYYEIPLFINKLNSDPKMSLIGNAVSYWHNKRMWEYVENGYECISLENLKKLGITTNSLD